jgi:hypothetical protein
MLFGDADVVHAVGRSMAAVIPTIVGSSSASVTISSENTEVQDARSLAPIGSPVSGSMCPTAWNWSAASDTAGS